MKSHIHTHTAPCKQYHPEKRKEEGKSAHTHAPKSLTNKSNTQITIANPHDFGGKTANTVCTTVNRRRKAAAKKEMAVQGLLK